MDKPKLTLREIIFEGIKKFAGEIIGVVLIACFLWFFPSLKSLFTEHTFPEKNESQTEIQRELEAHRKEEERLKEELKRHEEALKATEAKKAEESRQKTEAPKAKAGNTEPESSTQTVKADASGVVKAQQDERVKEAATQAKQKSGVELLREVLEKYGPEDFFSATLNPKIFYDEKTNKPYIQVTEKFNQSVFWDKFLPELRKALDGVATKKTKYRYLDNVRKANQNLTRTGYLLGGGVEGIDWVKVPYSMQLRDNASSTFFPHEVFDPEDGEWLKHWRVVIPDNNASFTVYDLPVMRNARGGGVSPEGLFDKEQLSWFTKIFDEDSKDFISIWIEFLKRMSLKVTYSVEYLDKSGDVISVQIIGTGRREFCIYRSIDNPGGIPEIISEGLSFAPGYVAGRSEYIDGNLVPVAFKAGSIRDDYNHLFLGTENFNQKYGIGYDVELDSQELQRLDSTKFEVIFE